MSRILASPFITIVSVSALVAPAHAGLSVSVGWSSESTPAAPAGAILGGMDVLANGNLAVFDGTAIVEVVPASGAVVRTIFTPPSPVFGSFVVIDPTDTYILFGESSSHDVHRVPLDGSPASVVANLWLNFACTFRGPDVAFITRANPSSSGTLIERLDVLTGQTDLIASVPGPSGPVAFDRNGDLFYGVNDTSFPAARGAQAIVRFDAAKVDAAIGPSALGAADASTFVVNQTAPYGFAFDDEGDLFVSDSIEATLKEYAPNGTFLSEVGFETSPTAAVGTMVFVGDGGGPTHFAPYQPATGDALYVVSSDFFSFNDVSRVQPRRATLSTQPASPVPAGPFTFRLEDGPPSGITYLFIASSAAPAEVVVLHDGVPFALGFDPGSLIASVPLPLDANGELVIPATSPGIPGSIVVQGALFATDGTGGSTTTLVITFT